MAETFEPNKDPDQRPALPEGKECLVALHEERENMGQSSSDELMKDPKKEAPPNYLTRFERTVVPPELDDSKREVPMMGSKKALEYYEKLVGHEKKSFGWIMKIEVFGVEVTVNIVMACLLKELEARCKAMGMAEDFKFKNLSGYVVKGGFHDYGMAIDFDAPDNWLAKPEKTKWNLPMAMVIELQKMGFKWGMYFDKGRSDGMTDAMHFEYRGTIEDAIGQLKSPEAIQLAESCVLPKRFGEKTLYQYALRDKESLSRV